LMASGPNGPRMLYLGKALDPITPAFILPEVTDLSKWYGGKHWYADPENQFIFMFEGTIISTGLSYNTKMIAASSIKSYWDLLTEGGSIGGGGSSVLALVNHVPHPNAAKVFINWFLSREGQTVWQNVMNKKEVEASDSMRVDISKDDVLPDGRRVEGRKYSVVGFLDPDPVQKLLQEILK